MKFDGKPPVENLLSDWVVTEQHMREIESAEFIWEEVIVYGHYQVWVAPPNGGKTTIAKQAAIDLGDQGVEVIYAQFDSGGPELKEFFKESAEHGVKLVSNIRKDPRKFVYDLLDAVERGWDPKKSVLFIDTLKKAAKTMSKDAMEEFGIAIRALTQKGLTVICLHHTTKRKNADGEYDPNGVSDVVDDPDEVFMLEITTDERVNKQTVIMKPLKNRMTAVQPAAFEWDIDERVVRRIELSENQEFRAQWNELCNVYGPAIELLKSAIPKKRMNATSCEEFLVSQKMPQHVARKILRFGRDLNEWAVEKGANNAKFYSCPEPLTNPTYSTNPV